jgi:hypothetical protein
MPNHYHCGVTMFTLVRVVVFIVNYDSAVKSSVPFTCE